jgi:hypothetical protein
MGRPHQSAQKPLRNRYFGNSHQRADSMQAADAQQFRKPRPDDPERLRMIKECMDMNRKYNTDPFGRTGGKEHMYHACMANHGHYH